MKEVINKLELDDEVNVFLNGCSFSGTVGENENYKEILTLHTQTGRVDIQVSSIVAVKYL